MECFDYTPIKKVDDILVSELDGYSLDEVGLLKNDCLGIKALSKIEPKIYIAIVLDFETGGLKADTITLYFKNSHNHEQKQYNIIYN